MGEVSTIGLDIAKSVIQVHGVDSSGGDPQACRSFEAASSSPLYRLASSGSKPARQRIIGDVSCRRLATQFG